MSHCRLCRQVKRKSARKTAGKRGKKSKADEDANDDDHPEAAALSSGSKKKYDRFGWDTAKDDALIDEMQYMRAKGDLANNGGLKKCTAR